MSTSHSKQAHAQCAYEKLIYDCRESQGNNNSTKLPLERRTHDEIGDVTEEDEEDTVVPIPGEINNSIEPVTTN